MNKLKIGLILILLCVSYNGVAGKISKAYEALKIYNYFEAKRLFEKSLKKETAPAAFGLSIIYFRNDNPFSNIDSAYHYIILSEKNFQTLSGKDKINYLLFGVSSSSIDSLKNTIHQKAFEIYKNKNTIEAFDKFISTYITAPECFDAIELRNALAFKETKNIDTYQAYEKFIETYPFSNELKEAKDRFYLMKFKSLTKNNTIEEFEQFLVQDPNSPFADEAKNKIYSLATKNGTIEEYHQFTKKYPDNPNIEYAWLTLYTLYTASYTLESLLDFKSEFPDFPFKDILNEDLELCNKILFPVRENGKWGFVDLQGHSVIPCIYEWVENFSEGLAECGLNNKSGFINKAGKLIIPFIYEQVEAFDKGFSVVQLNDKYGLINKLGKRILSYNYDEISEF